MAKEKKRKKSEGFGPWEWFAKSHRDGSATPEGQNSLKEEKK
jgi:hypothetical protein